MLLFLSLGVVEEDMLEMEVKVELEEPRHLEHTVLQLADRAGKLIVHMKVVWVDLLLVGI
jgi:hypothetical protein